MLVGKTQKKKCQWTGATVYQFRCDEPGCNKISVASTSKDGLIAIHPEWLIKREHNGCIDFKCDDCEKVCYTPYSRDGKLFKNFLKWKEWLRLQDGRTLCPVCLERRSMGRLMFSWGKFVRVRQELEKETGINNKAVLYRLWQLRGVFPDIKITGIETDWKLKKKRYILEPCIASIYDSLNIYECGEIYFVNIEDDQVIIGEGI